MCSNSRLVTLLIAKNLRIDRGQFAFNEDPWEQIYFLVSGPILLSPRLAKKKTKEKKEDDPFLAYTSIRP